MPEATAMKELRERKRLLVIESELNRQALRVHCSRLEGPAQKAEGVFKVGRVAVPALFSALSAGALFAGGKERAVSGLIGKALSGVQLLQSLKPLWTTFVQRGRGSGEAESAKAPDPAAARE